MLHSGSRGIGNRIGTYFIEQAKKEMEKWFIHLPDTDLAYFPLGSTMFDEYFEAVHWAQEYAAFNRRMMMEQATLALNDAVGKPFTYGHPAVNCHHN